MARLLNKAYIGTKESFECNKERFEHFQKIDDVEVYVNRYGDYYTDLALVTTQEWLAFVTTQEWKDYVRGDRDNPPDESEG